jgi:glycosyltransferase involved in cell wall biosynthesis
MHTKHTSVSFVSRDNYLNFPYMVKYGKSLSKGLWIQKYWKNADVLHIHNYLRVINCWPKPNPKISKIIHQHGRNSKLLSGGYKSLYDYDYKNKYLRVVSTLNLLPYVNYEEKYWLPSPMDIELFDNIKGKYYKKHDTIKICQTATRLPCKGTDIFINAMEEVMEKYKNVEMVLIQDKPWYECQKIKSSCDILFDQFLSYGTTCLESWCFGYPAVTAMTDETYSIISSILGENNIPFVRANEKNLSEVLCQLVESESMRREYANKGRKYVEKYHDYPVVAKRAIELYKESMETFGNIENNVELISKDILKMEVLV